MKDTEIKVNNKIVGEYDMIPDDNRPDWEQDDLTKANYIKNRPGYKYRLEAVCTKNPVDVISAKAGDTFRMDEDVNSYGGHAIYIGIINVHLQDRYPIYRSRIKQDFFNTELKAKYTAYWDLNNTGNVLDIGSKAGNSTIHINRSVDAQYQGESFFRVYLVTDPAYLKDEYKTRFLKKGVYLEFLKMPRAVAQYCNLSFETYYYRQFDGNYIPRQAFLVPEPAADDEGKFLTTDNNGKIVWDVLPDIVPAATAADAGKVLMIGSDGKPTWTTLPTSTSENTQATT